MSKVRDSMKPHRMDNTLQVDGILTLYDAFFQKTYSGDYPSDSSQDYNSKTRFRIYMLSSSRFSRPY